MEYIKQVMSLLSKSYSPFHVVKNIKEELLKNGYIELDEKENFALEKGRNYFVTRNDSSIIAFAIPARLNSLSFQISASHTDSPTFKLKPSPIVEAGNLLKLDTEPYGGGIYNTWMDRPLSIAGRVLVKEGDKINTHLLNIDQDLLFIPNVAIHMNREINRGYNYNPAVDMLPLFGEKSDHFDFEEYLLEQLGLDDGKIISHDLFLYNRDLPRLVGKEGEFLSSGREDDLASTYTALLGLLNSRKNTQINVYAAFDNEEVGSLTKQGANSTFLKDIIQRIVACFQKEKDDYHKAVASSVLISIDNAHANHPNHPELSDKKTDVKLNGGIVIKYNADQRYTSDSFSSSIVKALCKEVEVPYQEYTNRSDLRGGSTLGNISNSEISLTSADIGIAQLCMHSSNELCGSYDIERMVEFTKAFFSYRIQLEGNSISLIRKAK